MQGLCAIQVVQQGQPCHLYFDLEFSTAANPELQGVALVDLLLSIVVQAFRCAAVCCGLTSQLFLEAPALQRGTSRRSAHVHGR